MTHDECTHCGPMKLQWTFDVLNGLPLGRHDVKPPNNLCLVIANYKNSWRTCQSGNSTSGMWERRFVWDVVAHVATVVNCCTGDLGKCCFWLFAQHCVAMSTSVWFSNDLMMGFPKGLVVQKFCRPMLQKKQHFVPKMRCAAQSHLCLILNHVKTCPVQSHIKSLCTRRFLVQNSFIRDMGRIVWLISNAHHTGSLMTMVCLTECVTPGLRGWDSILGRN